MSNTITADSAFEGCCQRVLGSSFGEGTILWPTSWERVPLQTHWERNLQPARLNSWCPHPTPQQDGTTILEGEGWVKEAVGEAGWGVRQGWGGLCGKLFSCGWWQCCGAASLGGMGWCPWLLLLVHVFLVVWVLQVSSLTRGAGGSLWWADVQCVLRALGYSCLQHQMSDVNRVSSVAKGEQGATAEGDSSPKTTLLHWVILWRNLSLREREDEVVHKTYGQRNSNDCQCFQWLQGMELLPGGSQGPTAHTPIRTSNAQCPLHSTGRKSCVFLQWEPSDVFQRPALCWDEIWA